MSRAELELLAMQLYIFDPENKTNGQMIPWSKVSLYTRKMWRKKAQQLVDEPTS